MTTAFHSILNGATANSNGYFEINGDFTSQFIPNVGSPFPPGHAFRFVAIVSGTGILPTAVNHVVASSAFISGVTRITPVDPIVAPGAGQYVTLGGGSYNLQYNDPAKGSIIVTPGNVNSDTPLQFPGRAILNYGEILNQNFLNLLENFAGPTPPPVSLVGSPSLELEGTLWYDTSTAGIGSPPSQGVLRIWNGTAFVSIDGVDELADLTDVANNVTLSANIGDVLTWDGSEWQSLPLSALSGLPFFEFIAAGGETVVNTPGFSTTAKNVGGSPNVGTGIAYQRVFLNGVLLREDAAGGFTVTGANQITINAPFAPLAALDEVILYEV